MVNEFKRIINSKGTMIIVNFLIILLFVLICSYAFDTAPRSGFAYKKYTSFDELKSNISDVQNEIEMFKENQIDDPETLAIYQKRIMVGKFLLENEIEYDYLSFKVTDNELNFFSSELFDGVTIFGMFASIILIVLMIVFSIMTLNHDSSIGVARLLFALGKTRKQILKEKYSAYITVLGLVSITFIFIISIVVIPFNTTFEKVLIVDAYNVYMIDINLYLAICCFSLLLFVLFFSTIVFAISMSIRGVYSAIFINVLFSAGYLLAMSNSQGIIASFINEIISYNVGSTNLVIYIVLYLVRLLLGVGFFLIARIRFLKRDIV